MAEEIERLYTVPLRNARLAPRGKRANRAVSEVRRFLARHMKADEEQVWLDGPVNEIIWARGIEKPPSKLRVRAIKFEDGVVEVSLPESDTTAKREAIQAEREKVAEERAAALTGGAEEEEAEEEEEKAEEAAPAEEEETPAAEEETAEAPAEAASEEEAGEKKQE